MLRYSSASNFCRPSPPRRTSVSPGYPPPPPPPYFEPSYAVSCEWVKMGPGCVSWSGLEPVRVPTHRCKRGEVMLLQRRNPFARGRDVTWANGSRPCAKPTPVKPPLYAAAVRIVWDPLVGSRPRINNCCLRDDCLPRGGLMFLGFLRPRLSLLCCEHLGACQTPNNVRPYSCLSSPTRMLAKCLPTRTFPVAAIEGGSTCIVGGNSQHRPRSGTNCRGGRSSQQCSTILPGVE